VSNGEPRTLNGEFSRAPGGANALRRFLQTLNDRVGAVFRWLRAFLDGKARSSDRMPTQTARRQGLLVAFFCVCLGTVAADAQRPCRSIRVPRSLSGATWVSGPITLVSPLGLGDLQQSIEGGMSGAPIVSDEKTALRVVNVNGSSPWTGQTNLFQCLPGFCLPRRCSSHFYPLSFYGGMTSRTKSGYIKN
jgi:hypothetical protein